MSQQHIKAAPAASGAVLDVGVVQTQPTNTTNRRVSVYGPSPTHDETNSERFPRFTALNRYGHGIIIWTGLCVLASDFLACLAGFWVGSWTASQLGESAPLLNRLTIWGAALLCLASLGLQGLYFGLIESPARELRKIVVALSSVFGVLLVCVLAGLSGQPAQAPSVSWLITAWVLSLVLVPVSRLILRLGRGPLLGGGVPVALIGQPEAVRQAIESLNNHRFHSFNPVGVFLETSQRPAHSHIEGIPVLGDASEAAGRVKSMGVRNGLCVVPPEYAPEARKRWQPVFQNLILVPPTPCSDFGSDPEPLHISGLGGEHVRRRVECPLSRAVKRGIDLIGVLLLAPIVLPVSAFLAVLVKMDSRGPILYSQSRVGRGGRVFQVWKFRSMVQNADDVLEAYLQSDPALRTEWEEYQKLYNDPRITRVGHFLRRTSLDELPQLWNIFVGQMSFIGPRPITEEQIELYGPAIELYKHVRPGLSGLWQVSGRNQTNFRRRAEYDAVYVRDWSIWLDLYLIGLTPFVVISGHGSN